MNRIILVGAIQEWLPLQIGVGTGALPLQMVVKSKICVSPELKSTLSGLKIF